MTSRLFLLICLLGTALVGVSIAWPHLIGGRQAWTEEDAAEHSRVMVKLHGMTVQRGHGKANDNAAEDQKLAAARRDFERSQQTLDTARSRGQTTATVLRWLGILAVLSGGAGYLAGRR